MYNLGSISVALTHALFIVTLPAISYAQPKQIDLTGIWIGQGYSCENSGLSEQVELTITGNYLTAKKITGDNCVPAGNITFQGTLPDSFSVGSIFPVTWTVGNPTNPASSKTVQNLTVLDANSLSSYGVKFTRMKPQIGVIPSKPSNKINLTGTWIENASVVAIDNRGCTAGFGGNLSVDGQDPRRRVFTLKQNGNQLRFPTVKTEWGSGSGTQSYQGTVSGDKVTLIVSGNAGGGFTVQSTGTISGDGNRVVGEGICRGNRGSATANVTFTWVRQAESQSDIRKR